MSIDQIFPNPTLFTIEPKKFWQLVVSGEISNKELEIFFQYLGTTARSDAFQETRLDVLKRLLELDAFNRPQLREVNGCNVYSDVRQPVLVSASTQINALMNSLLKEIDLETFRCLCQLAKKSDEIGIVAQERKLAIVQEALCFKEKSLFFYDIIKVCDKKDDYVFILQELIPSALIIFLKEGETEKLHPAFGIKNMSQSINDLLRPSSTSLDSNNLSKIFSNALQTVSPSLEGSALRCLRLGQLIRNIADLDDSNRYALMNEILDHSKISPIDSIRFLLDHNGWSLDSFDLPLMQKTDSFRKILSDLLAKRSFADPEASRIIYLHGPPQLHPSVISAVAGPALDCLISKNDMITQKQNIECIYKIAMDTQVSQDIRKKAQNYIFSSANNGRPLLRRLLSTLGFERFDLPADQSARRLKKELHAQIAKTLPQQGLKR